jgi:exopolysaccharide biosynthesis polyprenyl glycosylphosphotransferase
MYEISKGELGGGAVGTSSPAEKIQPGPSNVIVPSLAGPRRGFHHLIERMGRGDARRPERRLALSPGFTATLNSLVDLACLAIAIPVATALSGRPVGLQFSEFVFTIISAGLLWIVASAVLRHYDLSAFERPPEEDIALVSMLVMGVTTLVAILNLMVRDSAAVPKVSQFLVLFWPSVLFLRLFIFRPIAKRETPPDEALIIGTGFLGRLTGEDLEKRGRFRVVGYLPFPGETFSGALNSRLLGTSDELERVLRTMAVSEVYIAGDVTKQGDAMQAAIHVCERLGLPFALPAYSFRFERAHPVAGEAVADGYLHYHSVALKPRQMALKRLFDIVCAALALGVILPLLVVLPLLIKLTSRGPIFFLQRRVGRQGRPFYMLKFRSMVVNAEKLKDSLEKQNERTGPVFKIRNDPRITGIGRFMRKYSLDELPQLINVLRGEMSVVGPRPPVPTEVALYEPWQFRRLAVRPGLTCLWQACADRNRISFEDWMYLDMQYIDHWSLAKDFALIWKTLPVVLTGAGER